MTRFTSSPVLLVALAALAPSTPLRAQSAGEALQVRAGTVELTFGGRLQTQLNTSSVETAAPSELFIRRARFEVEVRVDDRVSGTIQPDFGGGDVELKDAYLQLDLSPSVGFRAGRSYRPFGLLEQTSSKRMLMIERGLRIRGLTAAEEYATVSGLGYSNRDIGLQILGSPEGAPLGLAYRAGVFRGPLHGSVGSQDSYQLAARATIQPSPNLRVGGGWSSRHFASPVDGDPELRRGHAFEIDAEYGGFGPGFHALAEISHADLDPFADRGFWGAQLWTAYRTEPLDDAGTMVEPVFRLSVGDPHDSALTAGGTLLTPGINLYLGPLNRIMLNLDLWLADGGGDNVRSFKAMFQLGF